jgi:hypothetical protein
MPQALQALVLPQGLAQALFNQCGCEFKVWCLG